MRLNLISVLSATAIALASSAGPGLAAGGTVSTATELRSLYSLETLPLVKASRCRQFSSYERNGGNSDFWNYLSRDEKGTALLAEMTGPGAIVRIWSANPGGLLKIYLDGAGEPVIATPFDQWFKDSALHPIRTTSSGGWISYWPIPYAKSCKVVVENAPGFYYHVTYQTFEPGTKVETYTKELSPTATSELTSALKIWRDPTGRYSPASKSVLGTNPKPNRASKAMTVAPGQTKTLISLSGPACLDQLRVTTQADGMTLQHAVVRAYWDNEKTPSIEAPFLAFFIHGLGSTQFASLPMVTQPGSYTCRFPMPFARSARIELVNGGKGSLPLEISAGYRKFSKLNPDALYFHAKWLREMTKKGVPHLMLHTKGRGHYVGCALSMQGPNGLWFLEGDELIYVDGEKTPSFNGTGTEDYFNCGWYFGDGPISQPLHGALIRDFDLFRVDAYRFHITDCVPFDKELTVKIEHGGTCDVPGADYSSVAYYYQTEPHTNFFKMPPASTIELAKAIIPPVMHALEAESLMSEASSGATAQPKWETFAPGLKGTSVTTLTAKADDASLTFKVLVTMKDRYELTGFFARGREYGKISCMIDSKPVGGPIDLSGNGDAFPSGPLSLAKTILEPGEHEVTFKLAGKTVDGKLPQIGVDKLLLTSLSPFIRDWQIIGPFDNSGIDSPLPPETDGFRADATYDGKDRKVSWKKIRAEENGVQYLQETMKPCEHVTAYAFTKIISPDSREAELLIGSDDSLKVWLNGNVITRFDGIRDNAADQDRIRVNLKAGENTLLLKIGQNLGWWGFVARLRDPDGALKYSAEP